MSNSSYSRNEQIIHDIETFGNTNFIKHQDIYKTCTKEHAEAYVLELIKMIEEKKISNKKDWTASQKILQKQIKGIVGVVGLNYAYFTLLNQNQIKPSKLFRELSRNHVVREDSGIISVSVMTSPTPFGKGFSCAFDCAYCPEQPGGVRSYISDGPTAARGLRNDYDPVEQMDERITTLFLCGHDIDKLEVLVLGGTWDSYEPDYQEWFITRLYYAANTFFDDKTNPTSRRDVLTLEEEKLINETTLVRIIGLTLETRPDQICSTQIQRLLRYGCTRVQIGVQHIQDRILKKVKRECYYADSIRAIKNLKDVALKVDIHIMPQLPGATQRDDDEMFYQLVSNADLQADQLKIYPCETTPWTKIEKWFLDGEYTPYPNEDMEESVMSYLTHINPWQRINRTGRDALPSYAIAGNPIPNLGQVIQDKMKKKGLECRCIRCREVGSKPERMARIDEAVLMIRKYNGSDGDDYFISFETPDEKVIFGFCRLRLTTSAGYIEDYDKKSKESIMVNTIPILNECAFIRELHVYGRVNRVNDTTRNSSDVQHRGFGRKLIAKAEEIAQNAGYTKMAIISGVGVREYYRKFGYQLEEAYMTKPLIKPIKPTILEYIFGDNYRNYFNNINNINIDTLFMKLQAFIISISTLVFLIINLFNNMFTNTRQAIKLD
jgi:ELP3 family radical SAM enzyme/protein acetyltransferase